MFFNEEDFSKDENLVCPSEFDFSNLLYNSLFSDFTILVPNPPQSKKSIIPAHRFILNSFSGYFHQLFEMTPNEKEISVCFPDWASIGIYIIHEYFYSGKPIIYSVENISSIVCVAFTWSVDSIKEELLNYLNSNIPIEQSLPTLTKIFNYIPNGCDSEKNLIELTGRGISLFPKTQFETLPYPIFIKIVDCVSLIQPDQKTSTSLCDAIEHYFQKNIINLGSHEFSQLVKKFTMKYNHNGIITLYKFGLIYGWNVRLVESKILHAWKNLDQEMLSQLPIQSLKKLLHENFLNIEHEDDLVDFIFLVYKNHKFDIDTKLSANSFSSIHSNVKSYSVSNFKSNFASKNPPVASQSVLNLALSAELDSSIPFVYMNSSNFKTAASDLYSTTTTTTTSDEDKSVNNNNQIANNSSNSLISATFIDTSSNVSNNLEIDHNHNNNDYNESTKTQKNNPIVISKNPNNDEFKNETISEDDLMNSLWQELRVCFLSKSSIEKLYFSPLVPGYIKNGIGSKIGKCTQQAPRLPRTKIKCLILGAVDSSALRDVRDLIVSTSFEESNIVSIRADHEFDVKMIFEFHSVFIFGFFKFWNREEVSKKLLEFHKEGGGVFVCYGTHRNDGFGIGEPFSSVLPIEPVLNPDLTTEFIVVDKRKTRFEGCKYMRLICRARSDGIVENYWDDGVPFLIRKGRDKEGNGAVYILNATPVSNDIIEQQWKYKDKHIQHMVSNAIIYVSNVIMSKRNQKNP